MPGRRSAPRLATCSGPWSEGPLLERLAASVLPAPRTGLAHGFAVGGYRIQVEVHRRAVFSAVPEAVSQGGQGKSKGRDLREPTLLQGRGKREPEGEGFRVESHGHGDVRAHGRRVGTDRAKAGRTRRDEGSHRKGDGGLVTVAAEHHGDDAEASRHGGGRDGRERTSRRKGRARAREGGGTLECRPARDLPGFSRPRLTPPPGITFRRGARSHSSENPRGL